MLYMCGGWHYSGAQAFSKLYIEGRPSMLFGSIQTINSKFYVTGVTSKDGSSIYDKALIGKLNDTGSVLYIKAIVDSDNSNYDIFYNALHQTTDGNLITTGYITDSIQKAFLMKTDTNGNILLWHEYTDTGTMIFQGTDVIELPDSGYLLAINIERNYISNVRIIRTDIQANTISEMDNGHYLVGAWCSKPGSNTPYWAKTWLLEVDRMGNMITDWTDTSEKNLYPNGMEQTADSGWIIARQHVGYDTENIQAFNASILKLDKNLNKEWEIIAGGPDYNTGMFDVKILNDGSYVCVGSDPIDTLIQGSAHDYGWVMKVSVTGQILWQRYYLVDSTFAANDYLNSVALMPDGEFVACGRVENGIIGQQGWIIRTDSNGCLLDNCGRETTEIDEINKDQYTAEIFPNPSKSNFTIKLNLPPTDDIYINVYDITGRLALHQAITQQTTTIQNQLSGGMYLWQIRDSAGVLGGGKLVVED